jgi:pimeloyl-ACP methyl ester carboxylesterase
MTGYDLPNQARDLAGLLDHLKIDAAHLIGSSAGGPIAMVFAATYPQRVRSLTLAGTAIELFAAGDPVSEVVREQVGLLDSKGAEATFDGRPAGIEVTFQVLWVPEEMAERGTLGSYWDEQRRLNAQAKGIARDVRIQHYVAELRNMEACWQTDVASYARRIAAPTLVLHGSNDREVPVAWGEHIACTIRGARLQIEQGKSHTLIGRDADARRKVIEFMAQQEGWSV